MKEILYVPKDLVELKHLIHTIKKSQWSKIDTSNITDMSKYN